MSKSKMAACIRLAMAKKGLSGKKLSDHLKVTETTVSRWRDKGCDSMSTLMAIANLCDMEIDEMMRLAD